MISIIIPVYNSQSIVGRTVLELLSVIRSNNIAAEILLVNDGSPDKSWSVISELAAEHDEVKAINLLKNYGQHTAVYCGIAESRGELIITMDDDLQNPPIEILKLINCIEHSNFDLVFAQFKNKRHASFRRVGTRVIGFLNGKIFGKPRYVTLTNFRIFRRELADRLLEFKTNFPYIPGLLLMHARHIGNVQTDHHPRAKGKSNYNWLRILQLVARILFNYSSYPLQMISGVGIVISALSFGVGGFFVLKSLVVGVSVKGWTTLVVLLSFLSGFILVVLGIMGEYLVRIMNQLAVQKPYQIVDRSD